RNAASIGRKITPCLGPSKAIFLVAVILLLLTLQSVPSVALTGTLQDRKSTRLNSSHVSNSYAVFCLKKKKQTIISVRPFVHMFQRPTFPLSTLRCFPVLLYRLFTCCVRSGSPALLMSCDSIAGRSSA